MTTYYKATRHDGRDFRTGTVDYAAALASGSVIRHPHKGRRIAGDASTYLSVSTEPADCTGFRWPCRLFRVEPVGTVDTAPDYPNKRTVRALRVVEELPAWMALGPNGEEVARFIEACRTITYNQVSRLSAARAAARAAAWDAARDAARAAAWDAAPAAAWDAARAAARAAAWDAAWALVVRDLITPEQFDILTGPWVSVMGKTWEAPNA